MSKEKVDAYNANKANRKKEIAKAKRKKVRNKAIGIGVTAVIVAALAVALGFTGWNIYKDYRDSRPNYERTEMIVTDYSGVLDGTVVE